MHLTDADSRSIALRVAPTRSGNSWDIGGTGAAFVCEGRGRPGDRELTESDGKGLNDRLRALPDPPDDEGPAAPVPAP